MLEIASNFEGFPRLLAALQKESRLEDEMGMILDKEEAKSFRGAAALVNYYSQDCPEALFAAKEASKDMANPRDLGSIAGAFWWAVVTMTTVSLLFA